MNVSLDPATQRQIERMVDDGLWDLSPADARASSRRV
jgi:hypothetical protein